MLVQDKPWDRNLQLLLVTVIAVNLAPHATIVPLWISALSAVCLAWKTLYLTRGWPLPRRSVLVVAAALCLTGVLFSYGTLIGQEAAGALLVLMASLKLLETNRYRDAMLIIFTSYFLLMAYILDTQSLGATIYMVIDIGLITALMSQVHRRERGGQRTRTLWPAVRLIGLTVPLWVFLFVFFPRFSTSLWNLKPPNPGVGFSDELDPGSIESLVASDEPAFRVAFTSTTGAGNDLSPNSAYWRGAILSIGDGLKWSKNPKSARSDSYVPEQSQSVRTYTVWLETGFQKWLFALDVPLAIASGDSSLLQDIRRLPGFTFEFTHPHFNRSVYSARSVKDPPLQALTPADRTLALQLPPALVKALKLPTEPLFKLTELIATQARNRSDKSPGDSPKNLPKDSFELRAAKRVLAWFSDQDFRYSKSPGVMRSNDGSEQLKQFLFETRVGFCEHYAGAFASIMRALGIPARVIVGFQGATRNPIGNYWTVRKMDAHAWTEIWQDEVSAENTAHLGRWIRIDPTESVAPLRIQIGGDFNRFDGSVAAQMSADEFRQRLDGGWAATLRELSAISDVMQMRWNAFLLSYDFDYQMQMLAGWGLAKQAGLWLSGIIAIGILLMLSSMAYWMRQKALAEDPLVREWRRFCQIFKPLGLVRGANEGPLTFAGRARRNLPEAAEQIERIAQLYCQCRYGADSDSARTANKSARSEFRQLVRRFSIDANSSVKRS